VVLASVAFRKFRRRASESTTGQTLAMARAGTWLRRGKAAHPPKRPRGIATGASKKDGVRAGIRTAVLRAGGRTLVEQSFGGSVGVHAALFQRRVDLLFRVGDHVLQSLHGVSGGGRDTRPSRAAERALLGGSSRPLLPRLWPRPPGLVAMGGPDDFDILLVAGGGIRCARDRPRCGRGRLLAVVAGSRGVGSGGLRSLLQGQCTDTQGRGMRWIFAVHYRTVVSPSLHRP